MGLMHCSDFTDLGILKDFQESLAKNFRDQEDERDQFFGRLRIAGTLLGLTILRSLPSRAHS
jgi:hypothetical protein